MLDFLKKYREWIVPAAVAVVGIVAVVYSNLPVLKLTTTSKCPTQPIEAWLDSYAAIATKRGELPHPQSYIDGEIDNLLAAPECGTITAPVLRQLLHDLNRRIPDPPPPPLVRDDMPLIDARPLILPPLPTPAPPRTPINVKRSPAQNPHPPVQLVRDHRRQVGRNVRGADHHVQERPVVRLSVRS